MLFLFFGFFLFEIYGFFVILFDNLISPGSDSSGNDMGWWKEEHFNASDADGDGLLNITEFNE